MSNVAVARLMRTNKRKIVLSVENNQFKPKIKSFEIKFATVKCITKRNTSSTRNVFYVSSILIS